jgi:hypothetical protein
MKDGSDDGLLLGGAKLGSEDGSSDGSVEGIDRGSDDGDLVLS